MSLAQEQISNTFNQMQERSEAPKLTPEQLNAIDLLIFGKTDKEVAELLELAETPYQNGTKMHFLQSN